MYYLDLKREMNGWKAGVFYPVYAAGGSLAETALQFYREKPFSLENFVNFRDNAISSFCVRLELSSIDTMKSIQRKIHRILLAHTPSFVLN